MATWSHHVILLVITQQYSTKSTFTYYLIFTYFPIYQSSFIYYKTHTNLAARLAIAEHGSYIRCETV